jgi:penicillin-binding protein-related factor A (putative recombinase)
MSVKSNNLSFSLLPLEKLEIQHLGMVSKVGRINFLFNDQKKVGLTFTFTEITSQQVKNYKKYNSEVKIINVETINNLAILADYFSYGYDSSEFIQDDQKIYYFILITILLVLLPLLLYLNIFS